VAFWLVKMVEYFFTPFGLTTYDQHLYALTVSNGLHVSPGRQRILMVWWQGTQAGSPSRHLSASKQTRTYWQLRGIVIG